MKLKKQLEKRAVAYLYDQMITTSGRINKKKKKIVFYFAMWPIFKCFLEGKRKLAFDFLVTKCGYTVWEIRPGCWFNLPLNHNIKHTWGEIQDIIRDYKVIRIPPVKQPEIIKEQTI